MNTPSSDRDQALLRRAQRLSRNMDSVFRIPGTDIRFGIDPIIGLIPGAGDVVGLAVSLYIVCLARQLGADGSALTRMCGNIALDALVGSVPLLGNISMSRSKRTCATCASWKPSSTHATQD